MKKRTWGIVMTVIGAFGLLGGIIIISRGDDISQRIVSFVITLILLSALLIRGIILIKQHPKVKGDTNDT